MVDQLNAFAGDGDPLALPREVRHRKASSAVRRQVPGVAGTWKDLTDNVNFMAVI